MISSCIIARLCSVAQLCPNLCDPVDCGLPGSSVCGILQARILERVAISFCNCTIGITLNFSVWIVYQQRGNHLSNYLNWITLDIFSKSYGLTLLRFNIQSQVQKFKYQEPKTKIKTNNKVALKQTASWKYIECQTKLDRSCFFFSQ